MTATIDVTGLPEAVVNDIRRLVDTLRKQATVAPADATSPAEIPRAGPPPDETPEQRAARFLAWAASHPKSDVIADDSRESIYEGRGE